jgi:hypothetical protein
MGGSTVFSGANIHLIARPMQMWFGRFPRNEGSSLLL